MCLGKEAKGNLNKTSRFKNAKPSVALSRTLHQGVRESGHLIGASTRWHGTPRADGRRGNEGRPLPQRRLRRPRSGWAGRASRSGSGVVLTREERRHWERLARRSGHRLASRSGHRRVIQPRRMAWTLNISIGNILCLTFVYSKLEFKEVVFTVIKERQLDRVNYGSTWYSSVRKYLTLL